jgi:hypothetical protein
VAALTFYFDRNFGNRLPEALARIQPPFLVEYHHSKKNNFPKELRDDQWLEICGKRGWIACSHDRKFHDIAVEAMAIKQHNVGAFYLPGASDPSWYKLCYLIKAYPKIDKAIKETRKPFIYRLHPSLRLERIKLP